MTLYLNLNTALNHKNNVIQCNFYSSRSGVLLSWLWMEHKKAKWSANDLSWIQQTRSLMEKIFGSEKFKFKTINKSVVVHEDSWPELVYDHQAWEENCSENEHHEVNNEFADSEMLKEETHPHTNMHQPKTRCSLDTNYYAKIRPLRQIIAPKWDGFGNLNDGIQIKLINTCPIDNYLTVFHLYFKSNPDMFDQLVDSPVTYTSTNYLLQTLQHFNNQEFATGKVHWLRQFLNFDFSVSATVNVWGSEQDMIMPCLAEILQSTQETICDSADCLQKKKVHDSKGIFIVSTSEEKKDGESNFRQ